MNVIYIEMTLWLFSYLLGRKDIIKLRNDESNPIILHEFVQLYKITYIYQATLLIPKYNLNICENLIHSYYSL